MVAGPEASRFIDKLDRELKSGLLSLLLLLAIERLGPVHGYGILQAFRERERIEVKEGTIYPLLRGLEESALIVSRWGDGAGGPPRKLYEITRTGRSALREGEARWRALAADVAELFESNDWELGE